MKLALHLPINSVSFGQVSTLYLRTLYEREKAGDLSLDFSLFPIGQPDFSSQNVPEDFGPWLQGKINKAFESHSRSTPVFKLWHLNGSMESYSEKQILLTFYELDKPTKVELNIAKNNVTCFSSRYSCDVFNMFGVKTHYLPLAFDSYNFKKVEKKFHNDDRIVFNVCGKLEKRKHHAEVIQAWISKYGRNPQYALQCATYNGFMSEQENNEIVRKIVKNDRPFNVTFYPNMKENTVYNEFINSADIIIGMSGGEGWGLPEFQSVALGKHAILLNAHSYKSWATDEMVTWVQPNGKQSAVDNKFFRQGEAFNQGDIFTFSTEEFLAACDTAIQKVRAKRENTAGLTLQQTYSKEAFAKNVEAIAQTII